MNHRTRLSISLSTLAVVVFTAFTFAIQGRKTGASSTVFNSNPAVTVVSTTATTNATKPKAATVKTVVKTASIPSGEGVGESEGSSDDDTVATAPTTATVPALAAPVNRTPVAAQLAPVPVVAATEYKNGTYQATGSYDSPAGPESIGVSITISNDTITNSSVTLLAGDRTSQRYQQRFASSYQSLVVGQSVDSVQLGAVSGSSLTPIGFNNALAAIKVQAKA